MTDIGLWTVLPASVTAVASGAVALLSLRQARSTGRQLAELTHDLEERQAENNARRDYAYEARKRLYAECEPLLFQGLELADSAQRRVHSLARSCREGNLRPDGSGWLAREDYYLHSSIYTLLAPLTTFKILQRKLTRVDLSLEPDLRRQYEIFRTAFDAFTDDHQLAALDPPLNYDPDRDEASGCDPDELRAAVPAVYRRQGYYRGTLDQIVEAMISTDGGQRCKSFGEFLVDLREADGQAGRMATEIRFLLLQFHPVRAPVLWRLLITQYFIYQSLSDTGPGAGQLSKHPSAADLAGLAWTDDDAVVWRDVDAAHLYARTKLEQVRRRL
jgi:hypothetical protein